MGITTELDCRSLRKGLLAILAFALACGDGNKLATDNVSDGSSPLLTVCVDSDEDTDDNDTDDNDTDDEDTDDDDKDDCEEEDDGEDDGN